MRKCIRPGCDGITVKEVHLFAKQVRPWGSGTFTITYPKATPTYWLKCIKCGLPLEVGAMNNEKEEIKETADKDTNSETDRSTQKQEGL